MSDGISSLATAIGIPRNIHQFFRSIVNQSSGMNFLDKRNSLDDEKVS